ncbi:uncharacterized protein LOC133720313 [Rosa rugosa]|uniref:uncharacterized protein LOC133720313 n=1 Tax=Rosa rugosa TaxID=74645 RepID=UPI002B410620|nr:uncharacterized protein LOC133720313 [Rosa rugosa]
MGIDPFFFFFFFFFFLLFFFLSSSFFFFILTERRNLKEAPRRKKVTISQPEINQRFQDDIISANQPVNQLKEPAMLTSEEKMRTIFMTFDVNQYAMKHNQVLNFFTGELAVNREDMQLIYLYPKKKPLHGFIKLSSPLLVCRVLGYKHGQKECIIKSNGKSIYLKPWTDDYLERFGQ